MRPGAQRESRPSPTDPQTTCEPFFPPPKNTDNFPVPCRRQSRRRRNRGRAGPRLSWMNAPTGQLPVLSLRNSPTDLPLWRACRHCIPRIDLRDLPASGPRPSDSAHCCACTGTESFFGAHSPVTYIGSCKTDHGHYSPGIDESFGTEITPKNTKAKERMIESAR